MNLKAIDLSSITDRLTTELQWAAKGLPLTPYLDPEHAGREAAECMDDLHPALAVMDDDLTLFRGVPVGDLPPTPMDGKRVVKQHLTEMFMLGLSSMMDLRPISYADEKDGEVIHQVCPVPGHEKSKSNQGSDDFALHIEAPHHPFPPDYLMLMGLRGNPEAFTTVSRLEDALQDIPEWAVSILMEPIFDVRLGESFGSKASVRVPVLTVNQNDFLFDIRVDFEEMSTTSRSGSKALTLLKEALWRHVMRYALTPGDLIFWNNRRVVHGRTRFPVTYDGTQRWLQRLYLVTEFPHEWAGDSQRPWVARGS